MTDETSWVPLHSKPEWRELLAKAITTQNRFEKYLREKFLSVPIKPKKAGEIIKYRSKYKDDASTDG